MASIATEDLIKSNEVVMKNIYYFTLLIISKNVSYYSYFIRDGTAIRMRITKHVY